MGLIYHFNDDDAVDEEYELTAEELAKMLDYSRVGSGPVYHIYIAHMPLGAKICVAESWKEALNKLLPNEEERNQITVDSMPLSTVMTLNGYIDFF